MYSENVNKCVIDKGYIKKEDGEILVEEGEIIFPGITLLDSEIKSLKQMVSTDEKKVKIGNSNLLGLNSHLDSIDSCNQCKMSLSKSYMRHKLSHT